MRAVRALLAQVPRVIALAALACSSEDEPAGPKAGATSLEGGAAPAGPVSASAGADAVKTRKCADCHGQNLAGSATPLPGYPTGVMLYSPNLTPDMETGIGGWTDGQLRLAIREGLDKEGMVLCPQMLHYRSMPDAELDSIIQHLRSLPPVKTVVKESVCPPLKR